MHPCVRAYARARARGPAACMAMRIDTRDTWVPIAYKTAYLCMRTAAPIARDDPADGPAQRAPHPGTGIAGRPPPTRHRPRDADAADSGRSRTGGNGLRRNDGSTNLLHLLFNIAALDHFDQ
jgi:hypothetical protein